MINAGGLTHHHIFLARTIINVMPVSRSNDSLKIDKFETKEPKIIKYFEELSESERNDNTIVDLLVMGILARGSVGTTMDAQYVEAAFGRLKDEFDRKMSDLFESDGTLADVIEGHFGKDGKIIKEIFNPDVEGTPLNRLKTGINDRLVDIQNSMSMAKGKKEEAKKGTQKGTEFEKFCKPFLDEIAKAYSDSVEHTGENKIEGGESKKGDFVVTLDDIEKKIVFEMKNRETTMYLPEIKKELNLAMENRNADYAVLISRSKKMLSHEVGWFNEYDKNKILCALAETDDDEENTWIIGTCSRCA